MKQSPIRTLHNRNPQNLTLVHEVLSLLDVLFQLGNGRFQKFLLEIAKLSQAQVLFQAVLAEEQRRRKVFGFRDVGEHVRALDDVGLAPQASDEGQGKPGSGVGHGEGC